MDADATIRNFCIISHVDHGKSTLADRMLELTGTVEKRKMRDQVLDRMELEQERGITIKMQPVQMVYHLQSQDSGFTNQDSQSNSTYTLNLIDTPGHIDFAYEVSRALKAVEGAVLLVDATQGVQAQTLSTLTMAQELGLVIIPAVSKIDSPLARTEEVQEEVATLLGVDAKEVLAVSGKTGKGVVELLEQILVRIPPPRKSKVDEPRALVFDYQYSDHRGIIIYVRTFDGVLQKGERLMLRGAAESFIALEVGTFTPEQQAVKEIPPGSIGYVVTGLKKPGVASVGDTLTRHISTLEPLAGYMQPKPVVWASVFPESQPASTRGGSSTRGGDDFDVLRQALERLRLTDASLSFEEETSGSLGRGFRCGFLGMLHLEIITERLRREFSLAVVITAPTVVFSVMREGEEPEIVYTPAQFPDHGSPTTVREPWVAAHIITPSEYVGAIIQLLYAHEADMGETEVFGERTRLHFELPLRELYRRFFDELKSVTSGYASLAYDVLDTYREADVTRLDVVFAEEELPALSRIVARRRAQEEATTLAARLHELLPRQQYATKIQVKGLGRILASKTLKAYRKDVTAKLYGGDVTRKRKLLEKQKKGKKRLRAQGRVSIPTDVFLKVMQSE